ncbi:MAG: DegT/DnrJ/EryC1/StrS family aminotransferase [Burkholderiales bacterium]|nr:DegT/DnrJ/EryC1/StrS family aminotransferase [Burkholderiales bacterium]
MQSGRLHRYGETGGRGSETALLEEEFAASLGARYCVAMSSCGATLFVALRALGVAPADPVLTSAFTLAPVPGAIAHANARAVLVEMTADCTLDLADLERKAAASGARVLLLSHMRGHVTDMRALSAVCERLGVAVIEDCAHTMGARWAGRPTGTWGAIGCFSAQTYKHVNSGEGGLLVTDDDDVAAQAILMSGSYMLYGQHLLRPPEAVFERWRYRTPNFSLRMSTLAAALLRPQLALLPQRAQTWNALYAALERSLAGIPHLRLPRRPAQEEYVASSIQFHLDLPAPAIEAVLAACGARGLHIKWFGAALPVGFTSHFGHWRYLEAGALPHTAAILRGLCDVRIPLSLTLEECGLIGEIVRAAIAGVAA